MIKFNLKTILVFSILLVIPLILAYNYQINVDSNYEDFNTDVYKCSDISCSAITFHQSSTNGQYSLIGNGDNYYAEYDYKECLNPHIYLLHVWGDLTGTENYNIFFSKKSGCKAEINNAELSENNIELGETVTITSNIHSGFEYPAGIPETTAIPENIKDEYSTNTKASIYANDIKIGEIEEEILLASDKDFEFEWTPSSAGTYEIVAKSEITDCACSSQNTQEFLIGTLVVNEPSECTQNSDCGNESFSEDYCKNEDVVRNHIIPSCAFGKCVFTNSTEIVEICEYGCSNGECTQPAIKCSSNPQCGSDGFIGDNFCEENSVFRNFRAFTCNNPGTPESHCSNSITKQLIKECADGCLNGECINQTIICSADSDCGTPHCSNPLNFCYNNDIFQEFIFYKCNNPGTAESYCSNFTAPQLILDCGEDSCDSFGDNHCKNDNVYSSRICYQRGCRDNSCFIDSFSEEKLIMSCTNGCLNGQCINQTIEGPVINLISPINNTDTTNMPVDFTYNVASDSAIDSCSLIIDSSTRLTSNSISLDDVNSFEYSPSIGVHNWLISCTNAFDMTNVSETRVLIISQSEACTNDSQCGSDFYSDKYCSSGDVYKDYHDFSCVTGECKEETTKELVKECDNGCKNGQCKSENNEDSWCIETNSCELAYDDSAEFDDSITLKSTDVNQTLGSIILNNNGSETEPVSYFWVFVFVITIIVILIIIILINLI